MTTAQLNVMDVLADREGRIIRYDSRELYLTDEELNDYPIHWATFRKLLQLEYIESFRSLSLRADEYVITKKGRIALKTHKYLYEEN